MPDDSFDRGVFEGQVIAQLANIEKKIDGLVMGTAALEARVRVLEQWRYWVMGGAAVAGGAVSYFMNTFAK